MSKPNTHRSLWHRFLFVALAALLLDQLSKLAVVTSFASPEDSFSFLPILNIVYELNPGVAFSLGNDLGWAGPWIFSFIAIVIVVALGIWFHKEPSLRRAYALGLIVGGALGNVIDRVRVSAVVDWLDFHAFGYHYPTFNIADSAIFVGACLLVYDAFRAEP